MRRTTHDRPTTLANMADEGLDIWCWCNGCCHHSVLATDMLIARLGHDQGVPGVAVHAYCGNYGSRDVETRPNWPTVGVVTQHAPNEHVSLAK